jgi:hypothetical protein
MPCLKVPSALLCLASVWLGGCRGCAPTPVPFKRGAQDAGPDASLAIAKPAAAAEADTYPDGTQQIRVSDTLIERPAGTIRASLVRDLDADGRSDVLLVATDENGQAQLEVVPNGANQASARLVLSAGAGCRGVAAQLGAIAGDLGLASVDFLCSPSAPAPTAQPADSLPTIDVAPPEPGHELAQTHHFVFSLEATPRVLLHVSAGWDGAGEPVSSELSITGTDQDQDGHGDLQIALPLADPSAPQAEARALTLTWLNRPSGLARERIEPEQTLAELAQNALRLVDKQPQQGLTLATQAMRLHALLCRESGSARLWVDDGRGLPCGNSAAAGKAAAASAIAWAKTQAVLPALAARAAMDGPGVSVDKKSRERVAEAVSAILGDTNYRWQIGPALRAPNAPSLRLPALAFIDENSLLLRGPIAQAYDLTTRALTPTGVPGSTLASDSTNQFALTDIVRSCDGYHVQIVPAGSVVSGLVTGHGTSEALLQPQPEAAGAGNEATPCAPQARAKSDHGGFVLLGLNPAGALFARGAELQLLPLDSQGHATGTGRVLTGSEPITSLNNPGPLDQTNRHFSLATSEGVVIVDRAVKTAKLVRRPASCAGGQVSDAALSPSGRKLAMLCGGHVYVAEPAAVGGQE